MRSQTSRGARTHGSGHGSPELIAHTHPPEAGSDRTFGLVFTVLFAIIGLFPLPTAGYVRVWALAVSAVLLVFALARPRSLAPANRLWMRVGMLLNSIVSPLALFIVYCAAVLPTALVLRALGKDPLNRRTDPEARSYWIHRIPAGRPDAQMKKQF